MPKHYCINRYNYQTNKHETICAFTDKREAFDAIENIMFQYVQERDGSQKIPNLEHMPKILSDKAIHSQTLLPGHYISRDDRLNSYFIYQYTKEEESVSGKLWGKYKVEKMSLNKVFNLYIVEIRSELLTTITIADTSLNTDRLNTSKFDAFVRSFNDTKTIKKIRSLSDAGKDFKICELRNDNHDFVKCSLARKHEVKIKDIPKYDDMVKEMKVACKKFNPI